MAPAVKRLRNWLAGWRRPKPTLRRTGIPPEEWVIGPATKTFTLDNSTGTFTPSAEGTNS
jgi:hypothetical protein